MSVQTKMIHESLIGIQERTNDCTLRGALETLVSYASMKAGVTGSAIDGISVPTSFWLKNNFSIKILQEEIDDHFMNVMEDLGFVPFADHQNMKKISANIMRAIRQCKDTPLMPLFLPPQMSRMMLMTFEKLGDEAVYIGVEPDILLYRIALLNNKLFQLPGILLNADPELHSLTPGCKNWEFVNVWERPNWSKMEES